MNGNRSSQEIPAIRATMATTKEDSDSGGSPRPHLSPPKTGICRNAPCSLEIPSSGFLKLPNDLDCVVTCQCPSEPATRSPRFVSKLLTSLNSPSTPPQGKTCLAVHVTGDYVAFVGRQGGGEMGDHLQFKNRNAGLVHVVNVKTNQELHLVGMKGAVQDLAFARIFDRIILAQVDELGNVRVIEITEAHDKFLTLKQSQILELVNESLITCPTEHHKLAWCPYIPQDDEDEKDGSFVLAVVHNSVVELFSISMVAKVYGQTTVNVDQVFEGRAQIGLNCLVTHIDLSPDGSIILIAAEDGRISFYQYDFDYPLPPELVQSWTPTADKRSADPLPVTSLWFLDDRSQHFLPEDSPLFWKFHLIGAMGNSILKIFTCEDWELLQSLSFLPTMTFSSCIDPGGKFLILADKESPMLLIITFKFFKTAKGEESSGIDYVQEIHLPFIIHAFVIRNNAKQVAPNVIEILALDRNGLNFCQIYPHMEDPMCTGTRVKNQSSREFCKTEETEVFVQNTVALEGELAELAKFNGMIENKTHDDVQYKNWVAEDTISEQMKEFRLSLLSDLKEWLKNAIPFMIKNEVEKMLGKHDQIREDVTKDIERIFQNKLMPEISKIRENVVKDVDGLVQNKLLPEINKSRVDIGKDIHGLFQNKLLPEISTNVNTAFGKAIAELKSVDKSYDRKQTIELLTGQGKINRALQIALESDDVHLIMATCKSINLPNILAKEPPVLETETILSTLEKLGKDFGKNSEVKSRYLQEIILHVDGTEPLVKERFDNIKRELYGNIEKALEDRQNLEPKNVKALRVLRMICQPQHV